MYAPRSRVWVKQCSECTQVFIGRSTHGSTCEPCRPLMRARRERERYAADPLRARVRVASSRATRTPDQVATEAERNRLWRARVGYTPSKRAADGRRRARKHSAECESFTNEEIFERDGWRCGICRGRIRRELDWPDPQSVSLDHVVPLADGGAHTRANVRAAHLQCNVRRSNRGGAEQLALLG